jgi:hypothetical protein
MNTYQLQDLDGESCGLIKTDLNKDTLTKEWGTYYSGEDILNLETTEIEDFVEKMTTKYPDNYFERFFLDGIITA